MSAGVDLRAYLSPKQTKQVLNHIITTNAKEMPAFLWGPPGIGKSAVVAQVVDEHRALFGGPASERMIDLRLSQMAPHDLRGVPSVRRTKSEGVACSVWQTVWNQPSCLPTEGRGLLFLDEMNQAAPAMQSMAQQLLQNRRVGDYVLPDGWFILGAGNRVDDRGTAFEMPSTVENRLQHLYCRVSFPEWVEWAALNGVHERIIAFLTSTQGAALTTTEYTRTGHEPAWPSPRSWAAASTWYASGGPGWDSSGAFVPGDIASFVGSAKAAEFRTFLAFYKDLPDIPRILAGHGASEPVPTQIDLMYATVVAIGLQITSVKEALHGVTWVQAAGTTLGEWGVVLAHLIKVRMKALGGMKMVRAWSVAGLKHGYVKEIIAQEIRDQAEYGEPPPASAYGRRGGLLVQPRPLASLRAPRVRPVAYLGRRR